jgi:3-hydroxyisobutyrate dehydrogenase-like beta-hydroxyacid dehydrogenase
MKVGFIGLGMQGKYMAINLAEAGYDLMVFDTRPEPLAELAAAGAKIVSLNPVKETLEDFFVEQVRATDQIGFDREKVS